MNINYNKIMKEYPKAYSKIINGLDGIRQFVQENGDVLLAKNGECICYCDLEKFFDDNGIIITITHHNIYERLTWIFYIDIYNPRDEYILRDFKTRDEAKEQAVYKAFEILEKQLEEKK